MAISYQVKPLYKSRNERIVADLRHAVGVGPPIDQEMVAKRKAAEIAIAMALLYGGDWRLQYEPENGLIVVARRRRRPRRIL